MVFDCLLLGRLEERLKLPPVLPLLLHHDVFFSDHPFVVLALGGGLGPLGEGLEQVLVSEGGEFLLVLVYFQFEDSDLVEPLPLHACFLCFEGGYLGSEGVEGGLKEALVVLGGFGAPRDVLLS